MALISDDDEHDGIAVDDDEDDEDDADDEEESDDLFSTGSAGSGLAGSIIGFVEPFPVAAATLFLVSSMVSYSWEGGVSGGDA